MVMEDRGVDGQLSGSNARCSAAVLPSNSPGVHTLWLPAIPLQMGLVLKPGSTGTLDALTEWCPPSSKRVCRSEVVRTLSGRSTLLVPLCWHGL